MRRGQWKVLVLFILPAFVMYSVFMVYPYIQAFYISLTDWRGVSSQMSFIGLKNFWTMLHDPYFWNALKNTLFFTVTNGTIVPVIALFFAVVMSRRLVWGARFFRITYFFPNLISVVAIAVLCSFVLTPEFGILTNFLRILGMKNLPAWLGSVRTAPWCIVAVKVWAAVGFYMILYLSALEGIPTDLYDAAKIDGASEWRAFWHVTLPLLSEIMKVTVVFLLLNGFGTFAVVKIMTDGGPNRSTETMATYLYDNAFKFGKFGYATAIAIALFLITFVLALLSIRLQKRETVQY
ncbi:MAG: sugar ABC transporter permease [Candidatus Latescibacterota bacterium]|nr:MAG: sugar ABC transporter permease [Candidatus Latescibacterota bacterium]